MPGLNDFITGVLVVWTWAIGHIMDPIRHLGNDYTALADYLKWDPIPPPGIPGPTVTLEIVKLLTVTATPTDNPRMPSSIDYVVYKEPLSFLEYFLGSLATLYLWYLICRVLCSPRNADSRHKKDLAWKQKLEQKLEDRDDQIIALLVHNKSASADATNKVNSMKRTVEDVKWTVAGHTQQFLGLKTGEFEALNPEAECEDMSGMCHKCPVYPGKHHHICVSSINRQGVVASAMTRGDILNILTAAASQVAAGQASMFSPIIDAIVDRVTTAVAANQQVPDAAQIAQMVIDSKKNKRVQSDLVDSQRLLRELLKTMKGHAQISWDLHHKELVLPSEAIKNSQAMSRLLGKKAREEVRKSRGERTKETKPENAGKRADAAGSVNKAAQPFQSSEDLMKQIEGQVIARIEDNFKQAGAISRHLPNCETESILSVLRRALKANKNKPIASQYIEATLQEIYRQTQEYQDMLNEAEKLRLDLLEAGRLTKVERERIDALRIDSDNLSDNSTLPEPRYQPNKDEIAEQTARTEAASATASFKAEEEKKKEEEQGAADAERTAKTTLAREIESLKRTCDEVPECPNSEHQDSINFMQVALAIILDRHDRLTNEDNLSAEITKIQEAVRKFPDDFLNDALAHRDSCPKVVYPQKSGFIQQNVTFQNKADPKVKEGRESDKPDTECAQKLEDSYEAQQSFAELVADLEKLSRKCDDLRACVDPTHQELVSRAREAFAGFRSRCNELPKFKLYDTKKAFKKSHEAFVELQKTIALEAADVIDEAGTTADGVSEKIGELMLESANFDLEKIKPAATPCSKCPTPEELRAKSLEEARDFQNAFVNFLRTLAIATTEFDGYLQTCQNPTHREANESAKREFESINARLEELPQFITDEQNPLTSDEIALDTADTIEKSGKTRDELLRDLYLMVKDIATISSSEKSRVAARRCTDCPWPLYHRTTFGLPARYAQADLAQDFPQKPVQILTSTNQLLCGIYAIIGSMQAMQARYPQLTVPSPGQLEHMRMSSQWNPWELPTEENQNFFRVDQLGRMLLLWGQYTGVNLRLGVIVEDQVPQLLAHENNAPFLIVWIHNDDAERSGGLNHFSGLRREDDPEINPMGKLIESSEDGIEDDSETKGEPASESEPIPGKTISANTPNINCTADQKLEEEQRELKQIHERLEELDLLVCAPELQNGFASIQIFGPGSAQRDAVERARNLYIGFLQQPPSNRKPPNGSSLDDWRKLLRELEDWIVQLPAIIKAMKGDLATWKQRMDQAAAAQSTYLEFKKTFEDCKKEVDETPSCSNPIHQGIISDMRHEFGGFLQGYVSQKVLVPDDSREASKEQLSYDLAAKYPDDGSYCRSMRKWMEGTIERVVHFEKTTVSRAGDHLPGCPQYPNEDVKSDDAEQPSENPQNVSGGRNSVQPAQKTSSENKTAKKATEDTIFKKPDEETKKAKATLQKDFEDLDILVQSLQSDVSTFKNVNNRTTMAAIDELRKRQSMYNKCSPSTKQFAVGKSTQAQRDSLAKETANIRKHASNVEAFKLEMNRKADARSSGNMHYNALPGSSLTSSAVGEILESMPRPVSTSRMQSPSSSRPQTSASSISQTPASNKVRTLASRRSHTPSKSVFASQIDLQASSRFSSASQTSRSPRNPSASALLAKQKLDEEAAAAEKAFEKIRQTSKIPSLVTPQALSLATQAALKPQKLKKAEAGKAAVQKAATGKAEAEKAAAMEVAADKAEQDRLKQAQEELDGTAEDIETLASSLNKCERLAEDLVDCPRNIDDHNDTIRIASQVYADLTVKVKDLEPTPLSDPRSQTNNWRLRQRLQEASLDAEKLLCELFPRARAICSSCRSAIKRRDEKEAQQKKRDQDGADKAARKAEGKRPEDERSAKEAADQKAKDDAARAQEEADRKKKEESDQKAAEEIAARAQEDANRKVQEEAEQKAAEIAQGEVCGMAEREAAASKVEDHAACTHEKAREAEADLVARDAAARKAQEDEEAAAAAVGLNAPVEGLQPATTLVELDAGGDGPTGDVEVHSDENLTAGPAPTRQQEKLTINFKDEVFMRSPPKTNNPPVSRPTDKEVDMYMSPPHTPRKPVPSPPKAPSVPLSKATNEEIDMHTSPPQILRTAAPSPTKSDASSGMNFIVDDPDPNIVPTEVDQPDPYSLFEWPVTKPGTAHKNDGSGSDISSTVPPSPEQPEERHAPTVLDLLQRMKDAEPGQETYRLDLNHTDVLAAKELFDTWRKAIEMMKIVMRQSSEAHLNIYSDMESYAAFDIKRAVNEFKVDEARKKLKNVVDHPIHNVNRRFTEADIQRALREHGLPAEDQALIATMRHTHDVDGLPYDFGQDEDDPYIAFLVNIIREQEAMAANTNPPDRPLPGNREKVDNFRERMKQEGQAALATLDLDDSDVAQALLEFNDWSMRMNDYREMILMNVKANRDPYTNLNKEDADVQEAAREVLKPKHDKSPIDFRPVEQEFAPPLVNSERVRQLESQIGNRPRGEELFGLDRSDPNIQQAIRNWEAYRSRLDEMGRRITANINAGTNVLNGMNQDGPELQDSLLQTLLDRAKDAPPDTPPFSGISDSDCMLVAIQMANSQYEAYKAELPHVVAFLRENMERGAAEWWQSGKKRFNENNHDVLRAAKIAKAEIEAAKLARVPNRQIKKPSIRKIHGGSRQATLVLAPGSANNPIVMFNQSVPSIIQ